MFIKLPQTEQNNKQKNIHLKNIIKTLDKTKHKLFFKLI